MTSPFYETTAFEPEIEFEELPQSFARKEERPSAVTRLVTTLATAATSMAVVTLLTVQGAALTGQFRAPTVRVSAPISQAQVHQERPARQERRLDLREVDNNRVPRPKGKMVAAESVKATRTVKGSPRPFLDSTID